MFEKVKRDDIYGIVQTPKGVYNCLGLFSLIPVSCYGALDSNALISTSNVEPENESIRIPWHKTTNDKIKILNN